MIDYYAIGQRIRQIRKARGLSQDQLAEQVGISTVHVSHIENANTKLSLPVFVRLTAAAGGGGYSAFAGGLRPSTAADPAGRAALCEGIPGPPSLLTHQPPEQRFRGLSLSSRNPSFLLGKGVVY